MTVPLKMKTLKLDNLIQRAEARIAKLDERIGQLMSQRVDLENALAALYEKRNKKDC